MLKNFIPARSLEGQEQYYTALQNKDIVFATGPAGTGKSFLALNRAIQCLSDNKIPINKIIIIRPYIFTKAENLGALPGTLKEKVLPFVQAVRDNLRCLLNKNQEIDSVMNQVEFLTLSTLRGRSFHNSFIIVEEAQNVPMEGDAMLTILTRMGKNSRIVIAGDLSQCDIHCDNSAFLEAANALMDLSQCEYVEMENVKNIPRNHLIGDIIKAFHNYRKSDF